MLGWENTKNSFSSTQTSFREGYLPDRREEYVREILLHKADRKFLEMNFKTGPWLLLHDSSCGHFSL